MGCESFLVRLRGDGVPFDAVDQVIRCWPGAVPVDEGGFTPSTASDYTVSDRGHIFEVEVAKSPLTVSCRFTLCHPASVDDAFLQFVSTLATQLQLDVQAEGEVYTVKDLSEINSKLKTAIARERAEWIRMFGTATSPATSHEAFQRYIQPHAEPVLGPLSALPG